MKVPASRYTMPQAAKIKKGSIAQIKHMQVPLKGLSLDIRMTTTDPLLAPILTNFTVEDDRLEIRAGYRKRTQITDQTPIQMLIPFYGLPQTMIAASNNKLWRLDGTMVRGGFTSDEWVWTSFSNLGDADFTMMVNGADGTWAWDGGFLATPAPVNVTLTNTNPCRVQTTATDIDKFINGRYVEIVTSPTGQFAPANGVHLIVNVNPSAFTFDLSGVNCSGGTTSMAATAQVGGSFVKMPIIPPPAEPWIDTDQFSFVISHQNRLFFADDAHLAFYFLPLMQKAGEVKVFPLNAIFKRGGSIRAMYSWTVDGGIGMDDNLVIFTSQGECAVYSGTDPATVGAWKLVGVYSFDAPMSRHSAVKYGGELYVLISTGLVPMTTLIRSETERLGTSEKTITSVFSRSALLHRSQFGWQVFLNPHSGRIYCNLPQGTKNGYVQMVRHMPKAVWSKWEQIPARCWGWVEPIAYFGDDDGNIFELHPQYLNNDGSAIRVDLQMAWSNFGTPANKHFNLVNTYMITDGDPSPFIDVKCDYDYSEPDNQPQQRATAVGSEWDVARWADDPSATEAEKGVWGQGPRPKRLINGVKGQGHVGGIRMMADIDDCKLAISGFDVIFEAGSFI